MYFYDFQQLVGQNKISVHKLDDALAKANSFIDYCEDTQAIAYI